MNKMAEIAYFWSPCCSRSQRWSWHCYCCATELFLLFIGRTTYNSRDDEGLIALHVAAQNGHLEVCQLIITNVEDKNPTNNHGLTPLHAAAEKGHLEIPRARRGYFLSYLCYRKLVLRLE